jgi:ADP-ribose pyrophosphatase
MSSTTWIRKSHHYIYEAQNADEISVAKDRILLPSGKEFDYVYVHCPYEVTYVVGIDSHDHIVLISQYRYLVDRFIYEIPAGSPDPGESLEDGARRELREETGCEADRLIKLASFYSSVGMTDQLCHIYLGILAEKQGNQTLGVSEIVSIRPIPFQNAVEMAEKGEIMNVGAAYGILLAAAWRRSNPPAR